MKIAQVAPLFESVPPKLYGGTERVISYLTEELVAQGHDVTLFASGDSVTKARLLPMRETSIRLDRMCVDQLASHIAMLEEVAESSDQFDLVHYHVDYLHFPISKRLSVPSVTTLHGRLDIPDLTPLYKKFKDRAVVSISNSQRKPLLWANWAGTVYHGLPQTLYTFNERPAGNYLAFVGRISPEKRVDRAIDMAIRTGWPLKIAAKVDAVDAAYFQKEIQPLLNHPDISFLGEIGEKEKNEFLGNATALLFPIDWAEPFGLVMIESMACGTPVIAFRKGSVPEIIEEGVNGFMVETVEEGDKKIREISSISRRGCRDYFEDNFSASRMAKDYLSIYEQLIQKGKKDLPMAAPLPAGHP